MKMRFRNTEQSAANCQNLNKYADVLMLAISEEKGYIDWNLVNYDIDSTLGDFLAMKLKRVTLALAGLGILTLYGCGGSSSNVTPGSSATTTVPVTVSATTTVPVTVIDGLINKATVCLDINNNGLCDTGEPSKTTDATGKANLVVENALVGKHAVIAVVGINAIDMDRPTTAITVPFTLKAPADQTAVITPLTTMVLTEMENMGVTSAVAAQTIQTETGITVPLFEDFTKGTTQAHKDIATLARLAVVTTQQQSEAVKAAVGTQDISGATITQLQLNKAVSKRLREIVAKLAEAAKNSAVANAVDAAAQETALAKQATTLLGTDGLTTATVATQVAIDNQLAAPVVADTPAAGFSLANLSVTDAANWYVRVMSASQAQNTPDAAGNVKYVERRFLSTGGAVAN